MEKIKKFVFYGCKQKNNNNLFLQLDLSNKLKKYQLYELSQD